MLGRELSQKAVASKTLFCGVFSVARIDRADEGIGTNDSRLAVGLWQPEGMKKRIALVAGIAVAGCLLSLCPALSTTGGGLKFSRFSAKFYEDGQLKRCRLSGVQEVDGRSCRGWVAFFEDGKLKQFQLAAGAVIHGVTVPEGSTVFLGPDGRLKSVWFAEDVMIHGVPVRGGSKVVADFHPNGRLAACFLRRETVLDGVPCRASLFQPVMFHPDGRLKRAALSRDFVIQGKTFGKGEVIRLDARGRPLEPFSPR